MRLRTIVGIVGALAMVLALAPSTAYALAFTLEDAELLVPGETVTFEATVAWDTGDPNPIFLDALSVNLGGAGLTVDDHPFFVNFPIFIAMGGSATGTMFNVSASLAAALGTFNGSATLFTSDGQGGQTAQYTQDFQVNVIPEPATLLLVGSGVSALAARARRRRKA
jgi:hypothetical protein